MENLYQQWQYNLWATGEWIEFIYSDAAHNAYLYKLVCHIIKGERAWLERIAGKDWNRDLWDTETKAGLLQLREANRQMMQQVLQMPVEDRIQVKRLSGDVNEPRLLDIILHIFYHSENHRGQLASYCAKAGLKYPMTDYIRFSF